MNAAIEIAATVCFAFFVLLIVALGQLTGSRRIGAVRYLVVAGAAGFILADWMSGSTGWTITEGIFLIVAIPFAIAHLTTLLIRESRPS